eukprot:jgi/Botrbrau1/9709/Bobra.0388s0004.1
MTSAVNIALLFGAPLPSVVYAVLLKTSCKESQYHAATSGRLGASADWSWAEAACAWGYQRPFLTANVLFFVNVCLLFWLLSLLQQSTWLIDPYWTILPLLIAYFFRTHPAAQYNPARSDIVMGLLWIWSIRLTHSYFRREEWQVGAREDWRYAQMRREWGRHWVWGSFLLVYLLQQVMLMGLCAPLLPVHKSSSPWDPIWDTAALLMCASGILIAWRADNELYAFTQENVRRRRQGLAPLRLLESGLWRWSRHPNYFGEQLWWWGLACFAVGLGQPWPALGALFNTLCMVGVTRLTEERMLSQPERMDLYREYQRRTSVWIPWAPRKAARHAQ